jgi:hypothetical protein
MSSGFRRRRAGLLATMASLTCAAAPVLASPVVCTTSLEAPADTSLNMAPVEVTSCAAVEPTPQLVERRFFGWTAPHARGVDLVHQITDVLGIAMAGPTGNRIMGFGFPDQTIVWDGSALQNTYEALLEEQSPLVPWRTADIPNGYGASLATDQAYPEPAEVVPVLPPAPFVPEAFTPIRGLW